MPLTPALANPLAAFTPVAAEWFRGAFAEPTSAQRGAWESIAAGNHSLVIAPTGSGKTLAAFLWALDRLAAGPGSADPRQRCRVLYVSPLKALAIDVDRNLRSPLAGMRQTAARLGLPLPEITVGLRTGDTPADERRRFAKVPPDVLVTTPESLFLILTSASADSLSGVETVILDEVHAVAGTKRGAHLALSLERLDALLPRPAQRIGLSATVRPVEEVANFLAGGRPVDVVAPPSQKILEIRVESPLPDMTAPGENLTTDSGEDVVLGSAAGPAARASNWPAVERRVLDLVKAHRSTIAFTNSRRLAERLTARLNELEAEETEKSSSAQSPASQRFPAEAVGQSGVASGAPAVIAKAHHGSMSREQRALVEEQLKAGDLPCVVATSSLELGIDMGAVDLVIQVEAPPSVASGLQRIGRAGHHVGAVSRGVMFPKYRGDLLGCAVVAERMAQGAIEQLRYPRNPLDVLAQQIVAALVMRDYTVAEIGELIRRAAPFSALPESALRGVLDMLAGRYPSSEFGELRPRIVWDRITDRLSARPGAQRLAVTSGGTIPDRGLFRVTTPGTGGSRVGELDEEMVYESRVGDTILLGTSSWQIEDITHDRVIVTPAPGRPARMPFWKGDAPGRDVELGRAVGALARELSHANAASARERLTQAGLDEWAVDNLLAYVTEQREATRFVPSDTTIVVERFRDELGDWKIVLHSLLGARVNAPWALAMAARLRRERGMEVYAASSDDGIVLRLPATFDDDGSQLLPEITDLLLDSSDVERQVVAELGSSALFAARFRECSARALLLPRRDPGRRSPLWQQRQKSAQLLEVASSYEDFPMLLEAARECTADVYDVAALADLMSDIEAQRVRVVEATTQAPSPFARSLLFGYVGMFLYEDDAPLAERRAAALSLDSTLLSELLGSEAVGELIDPDVLAELENALQRLAPERAARNVEHAADILRFLGDLSESEAQQRGIRPEWLAELHDARRVVRVRIAGEARWIAIEDAGRVRDALGVALPVGIPAAFTEPVMDPLGDLVARFARTHGPFSIEDLAARFGLGLAVASSAAEKLRTRGSLLRGQLRPSTETNGRGTQYCDSDVFARLRRGSLAKLRAEVEPAEPAALGLFLPQWHGIGSGNHPAVTADDVLDVVEQLAGTPLVAGTLESLVLPARLPGYSPALLDELCAAGELAWSGCGTLGGNASREADGWVTLVPADLAPLLLRPGDPEVLAGPLHAAVRDLLAGGALFFPELAERCSDVVEKATPDDVLETVWDLVWSGWVT
ncbi:MAG TPA: DEAD/DEAH box helicase, partial [Mycobacteriales bacterium]|nr:DEAD/DEAH box helicase [Mycobacteriales bacterium]